MVQDVGRLCGERLDALAHGVAVDGADPPVHYLVAALVRGGDDLVEVGAGDGERGALGAQGVEQRVDAHKAACVELKAVLLRPVAQRVGDFPAYCNEPVVHGRPFCCAVCGLWNGAHWCDFARSRLMTQWLARFGLLF